MKKKDLMAPSEFPAVSEPSFIPEFLSNVNHIFAWARLSSISFHLQQKESSHIHKVKILYFNSFPTKEAIETIN